MTARVAQIWRHPIKAHGREALAAAELTAGQALPWDRAWAVAHEAARLDGAAPGWAPCANFSRGAKAPQLQAIDARLDEAARRIHLTHPARPPISFAPDEAEEAARFIDWLRPLAPPGRAAPARLVAAAPGRGMTDSPFASVALLNLASNAEVGARLGRELDLGRWRGNLILDGLPAWEEFAWVGRRLRLGTGEAVVRQRITRCLATAANPATGDRDADTLGALQSGWGHQDFGVYLEITASGRVAVGDSVALL
jgi:uncharacterized protein YcbX